LPNSGDEHDYTLSFQEEAARRVQVVDEGGLTLADLVGAWVQVR